MNIAPETNPPTEPSAPRQERLGTVRALTGLFGAPAAWLSQLMLSEPLAAHACYPYQAPLSEPIWEELPALLALISLACLAVALLSGLVAWTSWREIAHKPAGKKGNIAEIDEVRTRFLVKLSLMSSFIFIVAVIFNSCAVILVSPCSPWF